MRHYATMVNVSLTGVAMTDDGFILCPLTNTMVHISLCEVDKANPSLGYQMGNVCMVSKVGNQERGKMQKYYGDLAGAERYINNVLNASIGIDILPVSYAFTHRNAYLANTKAIVECDKNMKNVIDGPYGV